MKKQIETKKAFRPFLISKENEEKRIAYCVVYEPNVVDLQGDWMDEESIEDMAHDWMLDSQAMNLMHEENLKKSDASVVESWTQLESMMINGEWIKKGSWVMGIKFSPAIWKSVRQGELTGVSIGGVGWEVEE